jgi:phosphopantothenoylcysteine decarboxylase/phosphopantothenate--cysteine ligase
MRSSPPKAGSASERHTNASGSESARRRIIEASDRQTLHTQEEAARRGAKVVLVTTTDRPVSAAVEIVRVQTAAEMEQAVLARSDACDVVVMAAAVADFRPVHAEGHKIKKDQGVPQIVLEPTTDILSALGARKRPGQTIVGFAAETDDVEANARAKLSRKGADLVVANDVSAPGAGFEHDTNAVTIVSTTNTIPVALSDKRAIARAVLDAVLRTRSEL